MKFLRTASSRRLLATLAGLLVAIAAGTAIAVAAAGRGPVPPPSSLAVALHQAAAAPAVTGISARISFTNQLIDSSDLVGSDPILTGATGRLWVSGDHRLRLELQSDNGDAQIVVNNGSFWISDPSAHTVYEGTVPEPSPAAANRNHRGTAGHDQLPTVAQIQSDLTRLMAHVDLSGAIPSDVAGRAAYTVRVSPQHDGGLLGAAEVAWDAARGVPLRVAVYATNDSSPVLQLKATDISYGPVATSVFAISPPAGAKVVRISTPAGHSSAATTDHGSRSRARKNHTEVIGAAVVARRLPFPLVAPKTLVGLPRRTVTLLDWGGSPAALVAYGQNLGGIAVIEQTASSATGAESQGANQDHGSGFSLPTVSINHATGQELDTALGTMVRFTRGGVTFTVVGSVPPAAADAAARAL
jgi:outer membrane lipoprotein-sorting protein